MKVNLVMFPSNILAHLCTIKHYVTIEKICCYCFRSFITAQILERHIDDCFEIIDKQIIKIVKKFETVNSKTIYKKAIYDLW